MLLIERVGCVFSGSEQCYNHTYNLIYKKTWFLPVLPPEVQVLNFIWLVTPDILRCLWYLIIFNNYYKKIVTAWFWDTVAQTPHFLRLTESIFAGIKSKCAV